MRLQFKVTHISTILAKLLDNALNRIAVLNDASSLEEFLRGFATFGMIVHVIEYIVHNA
jgi:hypothetical protein